MSAEDERSGPVTRTYANGMVSITTFPPVDDPPPPEFWEFRPWPFTELNTATAGGAPALPGVPDQPLLTKREAARYLRMSERTLERQVLPQITRVQVGGRQLIEREELERWLESQKVGPSSRTRVRERTSFASDTAAAIRSDPRARQILDELE